MIGEIGFCPVDHLLPTPLHIHQRVIKPRPFLLWAFHSRPLVKADSENLFDDGAFADSFPLRQLQNFAPDVLSNRDDLVF